jgi:hypothetical protein
MKKQQIIIEATRINSGGAKSLLKTLVNFIVRKNIEVLLFIDNRNTDYDYYNNIDKCTVITVKGISKILFYFKNNNTNIIYFSNLPPFRKNKAKT